MVDFDYRAEYQKALAVIAKQEKVIQELRRLLAEREAAEPEENHTIGMSAVEDSNFSLTGVV